VPDTPAPDPRASTLRGALRPLYRALLGEGMRARLRPLTYPADTAFRAALWRAAQGAVAAGPFTGLKLAPRPFLPHLLGTYERELHPTIDALCTRKWRRVINIGGGNGFYIAGLGRRIPGAELIVFELTAEARAVIAATMTRNGLQARMTILGAADQSNFAAALGDGEDTLVVIDVEGLEIELTDLTRIPGLRRATLLVETHDVIRSGCRDAVVAHLGATHAVNAIPTQPRTLADFPRELSPWLMRLAPSRCVEAVQEWRGGPQEWLLLEPR
jgi:hypothetical protein